MAKWLAQGTQCCRSKKPYVPSTTTISFAAGELPFKPHTKVYPCLWKGCQYESSANRKRKGSIQLRCGMKSTFFETDATSAKTTADFKSLNIFMKMSCIFFRNKGLLSALKKILIYSCCAIWTKCLSSKGWFPDRILKAFKEENIVAA